MNLYDEFFSIVEAFEKNDITYAVIGGFALAFHEKPRFTEDIDALVSHNDLEKSKKLLEDLRFFRSTDPHPFLKTSLVLHQFVKTIENDYLILDLLAGKDDKFEDFLKNNINFDWEKGTVSVISREDLIRLKEMRNSDQDKVDIKQLRNDEKEDNGRAKG